MEALPPHAGQVLHPVEIAGLDYSGDHPRMPQGYAEEDTGEFDMRSGFTAPISLPAETWLTDNVLKLSALEILLRGRKAELLKDLLLHPTTDTLRRMTPKDRETYVDRKQKDLGARGAPMFQNLSYVKYGSGVHPELIFADAATSMHGGKLWCVLAVLVIFSATASPTSSFSAYCRTSGACG